MALAPIPATAWGTREARHLLNRAGFGFSQARMGEILRLGPADAVQLLLGPAEGHAGGAEPDFLVAPMTRRDINQAYADLDEDELRLKYQAYQNSERRAVDHLKAWWLERMYTTQHPLHEKMTLFWHGHFAVSAQKVRSSQVIYDLNRVLRKFALGNFKTLTTAVGQTPAMLDYLDNRKSTRKSPNENWARELMELFTLGKGNYTEDDIKQAARAFSGWTCDFNGFIYDEKRVDGGEKSFMGRTGKLTGWDILDTIFEQPAVSTFVVTKLWEFFAYEDPEPEIVQPLAAQFRESNYEIRPLLETMLTSEAFYAPRAQGTQVKSPVQFVLQSADDLGLKQPPYAAMAQVAKQLGQELFYPPNVKGWDGNRAWANANAMLIRYNAAPVLIAAAERQARQSQQAKKESTAPESMEMSEMSMETAEMTDAEPKPPRNAASAMEAWRKQAMDEVREKLQSLPVAERKERREALKAATPTERLAMLKELGIEPPVTVFENDPLGLFDDLNFTTAGECLAALERRLLAAPLNPAQRAVLLGLVGAEAPEAPLRAQDLDFEERRALLRLIGSLPQYQLC